MTLVVSQFEKGNGELVAATLLLKKMAKPSAVREVEGVRILVCQAGNAKPSSSHVISGMFLQSLTCLHQPLKIEKSIPRLTLSSYLFSHSSSDQGEQVLQQPSIILSVQVSQGALLPERSIWVLCTNTHARTENLTLYIKKHKGWVCFAIVVISLTSSVTRGTVKAVPLFLLIFNAWRVFSLSTQTHTPTVCCAQF